MRHPQPVLPPYPSTRSSDRNSAAPERLRPQRADGNRIRLPKEERELRILQEAIRFFAEVGLAGDTRELARRCHVTHPLLFRYFPTKQALIERVYQAVYVGRWNAAWERIIVDRSLPLRDRMILFYKLYARTILSYEWVRLFMFAGLKGADINQRIFAFVTSRIVKPLCREIRHEFRLPDSRTRRISRTELELIWGLNSRIFYFGVRKYIYGMPLPDNLDELIEIEINTFFEGVGASLRRLLANGGEARRATRHGRGGGVGPRA